MPLVTTWRMRVACWIPKATDTHSEYVIMTAFPLQHWLQERASMLRYRYTLPSLLQASWKQSKISFVRENYLSFLDT
jgi:hypothetical protein